MEAAYSRYFEVHACDVMVTPAGPPAVPHRRRARLSQTSSRCCCKAAVGRYGVRHVVTTLRAPCLALPTPARHEGLDIPTLATGGPASWGRPYDDKKLLKAGIALEAAMKQQPPPQ